MCEKLTMTLGQDMSCYASIKIPTDTVLSPVNLTRIADEAAGNLVFEADWSTCCALRIVSVSDGQGNNLVQDLVVDPSPFDVGQQLSLFLADKVEWGQLLDSASRFGLIPQVESQVMSGHIELPSEEMTIKFQVRKGATRMEMDVAFFHALCQIASVQYNEVKQAAGESIDD
ncbi:MAG: hypothetical protein E6Q82_01670 [Thiobacillus sp.]|nr:MAG: hypothetical protein E6Q82_01670 [Thiobacillus sp.]